MGRRFLQICGRFFFLSSREVGIALYSKARGHGRRMG